ncbi:MAG: TetR/AcrR family transcriptional regulator [Petrimonas sp.]|nr:TetR/AcrR family transcriptional regulator [Petrimonas sp.]
MESLVSLMETRPYKDITVSEISDRAGLVRKTFYRNFDSKEDVLIAYFDTLTQNFTTRLDEIPALTTSVALRVLFKLCKENEKFLLSLKRSNMMGFMLEYWNRVLPALHAKMLDRLKNFPQTSHDKALEYLLIFNVGGTLNIILKWINEGFAISPDGLADLVSEFSQNSLNSSKSRID